jgi:arsenite/tail-anchored protein-transporting ATPase
MTLPFVTKDNVDLTQRGDELMTVVGSYKRKVILPRVLMGRPVRSARFVDQRLHILFGERATEEKS